MKIDLEKIINSKSRKEQYKKTLEEEGKSLRQENGRDLTMKGPDGKPAYKAETAPGNYEF